MKILISGLVLMALTGCVSNQERIAMQAQNDDAKCRSFGATPGTDVYVQCRMSQQQQRTQLQAAIMSSGPTSCSKYGNTVTCY